MAVTLPRPEPAAAAAAAGRDGAAVKSRCTRFGGHACGRGKGEEVPGQHDCFQPRKCGGILRNWRRAGEVSFVFCILISNA